jgi:electron transfer flavoprotein alpha subunit
MSTLVFIETSEGKVRKSSIEALCYAVAMGGKPTALVIGNATPAELEQLGKYGAAKVLHASVRSWSMASFRCMLR